MEIENKLRSMGLALPEVPKPVGAYIPAVQSGNHVFTSGQIHFVKGKLLHKGKVGGGLTVEEGYECARISIMNCLAAVKSIISDLDRIKRVVRVTGFVSSAPGFEDQPKVLNGASDLLLEIFGEKGRHTRLAIGTNELPLGAAVEIEMIVEV